MLGERKTDIVRITPEIVGVGLFVSGFNNVETGLSIFENLDHAGIEKLT